MYKIIIKVDTCDADYNISVNDITSEDLETIKPLIKAISEFKPYIGTREDWKYPFRNNFPHGRALRKDLGEKSPEELYPGFCEVEVWDLLYELLPSCEYGFHTLVSVEFHPKSVTVKLL